MSGHSKWKQIKHKKAEADAKRGSAFTRHAKLIAIAARKGGDPTMNPSLYLAIENAKAANMPNVNIERAIKKGTGDDKEGAQIEELFYEGFAPGGVALYVHALTDNKNRTASEIRHHFSKLGGNMGGAGTVAWMFENKGVLVFENLGGKKDELEMAAIENGAEDLRGDNDYLEVLCAPADFNKLREALTKAGFAPIRAGLEFQAKEAVTINDTEVAQQVMKLIETLEEDEDVNKVYSNFELGENVTLL